MLASTAIREAHQAGLPAEDIVPVGGVRRFSPVDGAVLLAVTDDARREEFLAGFFPAGVRSNSPRQLLRASGFQPRSPGSACGPPGIGRGGACLAHRDTPAHEEAAGTGCFARFEVCERSRTRRRHFSIIKYPDEQTFYRLLDLPYIAPELREGEDEIDAAERGSLPSLVTTLHIRGDLHMHSSWSDGRDSIMHMVLSARQLGYEYVAITDHSRRSWASRKLLSLEVPLQREEIDTVRSHEPGIEILHGVEVDIMPDGSLDFDDDTLAGFDIVLASLHDANGQDGGRLTARYLQAMRHPLVNVILRGESNAGDVRRVRLDFDRLFEVAIETGTWKSTVRRVTLIWMDGSPDARRPRGDHRYQQRLPSSRDAWAPDELRYRHRPPRLGGARPGAEYQRNRYAPGCCPETWTLGAVSQRNLTDQTRHPPCWYRRQAADDRWSSSVLCDCLHLLSCYFLYLFWALPKRVEALRNWPRRFRSDTRACATSPRTSLQTYRGGVLRTETRERGT